MEADRPSLIINPVAGPLWRRWKAGRLIAHLKTLFPNLSVHPTVGAGDGERLARALAAGGSDLILAAGGDGTYHEVINGLREASVPLGILPMGTGNSLVRELGLPADPIRAATALRNGSARPVYLGKMNGRLFVLMVGAGFDADVVRRVPPAKKRMGMPAYMMAGILALFTYDYRPIRFRVDGRELEGTSGIISKGRCYGGPFKIAPGADLERPDLVLCLLKGRGPVTYMKYTLGVITGLHPRMSGVEFYTAREIEVETPVPIQADGEALGLGPVRLSIVPRTLSLVFP